MRVLLVEDEKAMRYTLSNLLRHRGHEVIAAPSAEKGLEELGDDPVDLVISDLRLPGMDGMRLIEEVKKRCQDVVPIIITAYGTLGNAIDAIQLSVSDFLRKPFDLSTFEQTMSQAEQRRKQLLENRNYVDELKENLKGEERKRTQLSRFVSKHVADPIISGQEEPPLAGQSQKISILCADISDFVGLSEKLDQKSLIYIVKTFYSALEPIMKQHGGTLDKFMGDGIMMVFSDSFSDRGSSWHALKAAVQIQRAMDGIRHELNRFKLPEISIHIGVSTGMAMACNIGPQDCVSHTYIGDAVNLAKLLQDLATPGEIIISETTASDLEGCENEIPGLTQLLPLPSIETKGKQGEMMLYRAEYESNS